MNTPTLREITSHKCNGLNDALQITAIDEPGPGNAHHNYVITWEASERARSNWNVEDFDGRMSLPVVFQKGPIKESGVNGVSNESLLAIVQDRLLSFQRGPYACDENNEALMAVESAIFNLNKRTEARMQRGVEGTNQR